MCKAISAARELTLAPVKEYKWKDVSKKHKSEIQHDIKINAHYLNDTVGFFLKDLHVTTTWDTRLKRAILVLTGSLRKAVLPDVLPTFLY